MKTEVLQSPGMGKEALIRRFPAIVGESVIELKNKLNEPCNSFWIRLKPEPHIPGSGSVEGKLFTPLKPNGTILLFEPGFPGDGSTRLEQLWLEELVKRGITVFAARHNGTIINGDYSDAYINCPERRKQAEKRGDLLLGEKQYPTVADWKREPLVMLKSFAPHFDKIYMAGHSFGAAAVISSLIDFTKENPAQAKKVEKVFSLSGTVGKTPSFDWVKYINTEEMRQKVSVGEANQNYDIILDMLTGIHRDAHVISPDTKYSFIVNPHDELVQRIESDQMKETLGRGEIFVDNSRPDSGKWAHDLDKFNFPAVVSS